MVDHEGIAGPELGRPGVPPVGQVDGNLEAAVDVRSLGRYHEGARHLQDHIRLAELPALGVLWSLRVEKVWMSRLISGPYALEIGQSWAMNSSTKACVLLGQCLHLRGLCASRLPHEHSEGQDQECR